MKKLTLLILLIGPIICAAQSDVTSFYGLPFGSTKTSVILSMKKRGYSIQPGSSKYLTFKNVRYGVRQAQSISFYFYKDKLYKGLLLFIPDLESKIKGEYDSLAKELSEKYGEGESIEEYTTPFEKDDGYFITALKSDKLKISTEWSKKSGVITLGISQSTLISISYQDRKLVNEAYTDLKNKTNIDL